MPLQCFRYTVVANDDVYARMARTMFSRGNTLKKEV